MDLVAKVVRAASNSSGGIVHHDDGGAAQSVTFPTPVTTTTPTTPSPSPTPTPTTAGSVWRPAPGTSWQWQITGVVDESLDVAMYDIDLFDAQGAASSYWCRGSAR